MDIVHLSKRQRAVIYLDTMVMTNVAASGAGATSAIDGSWHLSSYKSEYEAITTSENLLGEDSNKIISNAGAGASVTLTLPLCASNSGVALNFVRIASHSIILEPNAADRIVYSSGEMSLGNFLRMDSDGSKVSLISDGENRWVATSELGVLTEEV